MSTQRPTDYSTDGDDSYDEDTAELPQLNAEALGIERDFNEEAPEPEDGPGKRATAWINDVEAEVERLRNRWHEVDDELTLSRQKVVELEELIAQKDHHVQQVTSDLQAALNEKAKLEIQITEHAEKIDRLKLQIEEQTAANLDAAQKNRDFSDSFDNIKNQLDESAHEKDRLHQAVQSHLERISALETDLGQLSEMETLQSSRLQDLECYIEGRRSRWAEQDAKIDEQQEALEEMSTIVDAKAKELAAKDKETDSLHKTILGLETQLAEHAGRRIENDSAFEKFQTSLQEKISIAERQRVELSALQQQLDAAHAQIAEQGERFVAQENELRERDKIVQRLEAKLLEYDSRKEKLVSENERLLEEATHLQRSHTEQVAIVEDLRNELEQTRKSLDDAKTQAADVETRQSDLAIENANHLTTAEDLRSQLGSMRQERDDLSNRLTGAQEIIDSLRGKLTATEDRVSSFESINISMSDQINRLQVEIASKQALVDAFDRSAQRLNDLNRQLHASRGVDKSSDQAMIINAAHRFDTSTGGTARQMIVISSDGGSVTHKLTKDRMTIGRSSECDICISDAVVSRIHAQLIKGESGTEIEDAHSTNGLSVNDNPVERALLRHGDVISLAGQLHIKYLELSAADEH